MRFEESDSRLGYEVPYRQLTLLILFLTLTMANRVQSPAGSIPDFRKWGSCRTIPLVGGFSQGSPVSLALAFWRCSILTLFNPSSALSTSLLRGPQISQLTSSLFIIPLSTASRRPKDGLGSTYSSERERQNGSQSTKRTQAGRYSPPTCRTTVLPSAIILPAVKPLSICPRSATTSRKSPSQSRGTACVVKGGGEGWNDARDAAVPRGEEISSPCPEESQQRPLLLPVVNRRTRLSFCADPHRGYHGQQDVLATRSPHGKADSIPGDVTTGTLACGGNTTDVSAGQWVFVIPSSPHLDQH
ncbi:hypothetical protein PR048_019100 [Dryococelus australis]|uniref:Uncharacterized protein n=1 Tax=Dryococelus australis TaxID=614101 RepID=A0ABQ9H2J4_9NEOP|nr:hypothetical protein PR048_019100 [Dryococelus australis]